MATADKFLGTLVKLIIAGKIIANAKSDDFDLSKDMIEVTNKDSAGSKEYIPGEYGGKFSCEAFMEMDQTVANTLYSFEDILTIAINGTKVAARLTTLVVGDIFLECDGFVSNVKWSNANNDASTYTFDFQITGAITRGYES